VLVSNPVTLAFIASLTSLTSLSICIDSYAVSDLSPLQNISSLTALDLDLDEFRDCRYNESDHRVSDYLDYNKWCLAQFLQARGHLIDYEVQVPSPQNPYHHVPGQEMVMWELPLLKKLKISHQASKRILVKSRSLQEADIDVGGERISSSLLAWEMLCDSPDIRQLAIGHTHRQYSELYVGLFPRFSLLRGFYCASLHASVVRAVAKHCKLLELLRAQIVTDLSIDDVLSVMMLPLLQELEFPFLSDFVEKPEQKTISASPASPVICPHLRKLHVGGGGQWTQHFIDSVRCPALEDLRLFGARTKRLFVDSLALVSGSSLQSIETSFMLGFRLSSQHPCTSSSRSLPSSSSPSPSSSAASSCQSSSSSISPSVSASPPLLSWSSFAKLSYVSWSASFTQDTEVMVRTLPSLRSLILHEVRPTLSWN